jgi:hypothetical protein
MVQLKLVHISGHSAQGSGSFMSLFENVMNMAVFTKIQSHFPLPCHIVILDLPHLAVSTHPTHLYGVALS